LDFVIAFLAAIGSCWLETAVVPKAKMTTAAKAETIFIQSSLQAFQSPANTRWKALFRNSSYHAALRLITNL
jgi:hypothetical protein